MKTLLSLAFLLLFSAPAFAETPKQSAYDRVMESKTLRCGYLMWEPYVMKNLATDEISGITYDYINAVAARLGLKVDWNLEVTIDQVVPAMQTGKMDMFCVPCSPIPEYEEQLDFVGDFGHLPYFTYVADKSILTDETLKTARFTVVDGFIPMVETPKAFPDAKITSLPQTTSMGELYDQIKFGKADAVVNEHLTAMLYMKNNPGVIRRYNDKPLVLKPMSFPAPKSDVKWRDFVNKEFATDKPENRAILEELMKKYNIGKDVLFLE